MEHPLTTDTITETESGQNARQMVRKQVPEEEGEKSKTTS